MAKVQDYLRKLAWARIYYFLFLLLIGCFAAYFWQPFLHGNSEASGILVNVFSILAGFLIAILTILGEPNFSNGKNWRSYAVTEINFHNRLYRHKLLFILYLIILALIFISSLLAKNYPNSSFICWIERAYLLGAVIAFGLSIKLPGRLMSLQMERFEEIVKQKKNPNN